jgi:methionyl-tRNA synthetase
VLFTAVRGLGTLSVLLSPVIPIATAKLWTALGGDGALADQRVDRAWEWTGGAQVSALEPLFPRIESIVEPTDG